MSMKLLILFTLAVSSCSASFFIAPDQLLKSMGKRLPQPLRNILHEYLKDPTRLNYDSIQLVFDELEFPDLLRVAEMSKDLSFFASRAFERNFAEMKIRIGNFSYSKPPNRVDLVIRSVSKEINRYVDVIPLNLHELLVEADSIRIQSVYFGLKTLKHFGKFIRKLELSFKDADTKAAKVISRYVDDYCSDSLVEFGLEFTDGDALSNFRKSFNHVEKLIFAEKNEKTTEKVTEITLPTNRTFPALRSFSFERQGADFSRGYMNCYFPHLNQLSIIKPPYRRSLRAMQELVETNSQIRTFECFHCEQSLMHFTSPKLVQVENLSIDYFYTYNFLGNQEVRFENVRKAKMYSILGSPDILLPKLQDLETISDGWHIDTLTDFLENHKNLSRFHLIYRDLDDDEFEMITSILPNLEEMYMEHIGYRTISSDAIIDFMEVHEKLMKFQIDDCSWNEEKHLRESLKEKWDIRAHPDGLSFHRKN